MESLHSPELLDELDGLNATRALILHAYYALRCDYRPTQIGVGEIAAWLRRNKPPEALPSDSLIQLTLKRAQVMHRPPGRPRTDSRVLIPAPPFCPPPPPRSSERP